MKRLHYFQHVPFENLGVIEAWARRNDFSITSTQFHRDPTINMPQDTDWLVVMGGPMGVYDQADHPWLEAEKRAVTEAISTGKVVLGICLGAQMIAHALGAGIRSNAYREIGWFPVYLDRKALDHPLAQLFPSQWEAFHWHGDTFDIPDGARLLATSSACRNQGFVFGDRVVGLQFHLEVSRSGATALVENCAADLRPDDYVASPDRILSADAPFEVSHQLMTRLLDHLNSLYIE